MNNNTKARFLNRGKGSNYPSQPRKSTRPKVGGSKANKWGKNNADRNATEVAV